MKKKQKQKNKWCACCKLYGSFATTITSNSTHESIQLKQYTNCHTQNVIYLITCDKCQEQYVGETGNSIHTRANQHRSDITVGNKNIPTVRHFKRCDRENMKLTVIEKLRSTDQYTFVALWCACKASASYAARFMSLSCFAIFLVRSSASASTDSASFCAPFYDLFLCFSLRTFLFLDTLF